MALKVETLSMMTVNITVKRLHSVLRRHVTRHNDTQHNDIQHKQHSA